MCTYYPVKQFVILMMLLKFFFEQPCKFLLVMATTDMSTCSPCMPLQKYSDSTVVSKCFFFLAALFFFLMSTCITVLILREISFMPLIKWGSGFEFDILFVQVAVSIDRFFSRQVKSSWICKGLKFRCLFLLPLSPEHSKGLKVCLLSQLY